MFKLFKNMKTTQNNTSIRQTIKDNFIATIQVTGLWMLYSGSAIGLALAAQVSDVATQQALIVLILVYALSMWVMKRVFIRSKQYKRINKERLQKELLKYDDEEE